MAQVSHERQVPLILVHFRDSEPSPTIATKHNKAKVYAIGAHFGTTLDIEDEGEPTGPDPSPLWWGHTGNT